MAVSGWCSQRGIPDCDGCRDPMCSHYCHDTTRTETPDAGRQVDTIDVNPTLI